MALAEPDLLALWDVGQAQHPIDRALSALAAATGAARGALADLPLGERDRRLLGLYRELAGPRIVAVARCPACGEASELACTVDELGASGPGPGDELRVELGTWSVELRSPTSRDLAAAARSGSVAAARAALLAAAVVAARDGERAVTAAELPAEVVAAIEDRLAETSPPAEIVFAVTCAACGHAWPAPFDPGDTVWSTVERAARRAMDTVAALARAYGWTEAEVLAVPPARRRYYLERA